MRINFCVKGQGVVRSEVIGERPPLVVVVPENRREELMASLERIMKLTAVSATLAASLMPSVGYAATETFSNLHAAIDRGFDEAVYLVLVFAGGAWMLGHRSKMMELVIGAACGYVLARHAVDIRDFLKQI